MGSSSKLMRGALLADDPAFRTRLRHPVLECVHRSHLSIVYRALHVDRHEPLALKLVRPGDGRIDRQFERFLREYEVIASLDHPNVVRILDLGAADDLAYIEMEYLEGGRLSERMRDGALAPAVALQYAAQLAAALDAVHNAGIVHRDVKPQNVMFRADGSLALIDFGLAKRLLLERSITDPGEIFGTPHYMSPEQGHALPADRRSDLYSLGCVLHEMLTGRKPFVAETALGVIYLHANAPRPKLDGACDGVQSLLDRLLAADPAARFATAADFLDALQRVV